MTTWTSDELDAIDNAEELTLATVRTDGTLRRPVTMRVVRDGNDVYVRPPPSCPRSLRPRHRRRR